jgi:hypothetical protein
MRCQDRRHVAKHTQAARHSAAALLLLLLAACGGGVPEVVSGPMPEGGNFTGVYFSPQYGEMNIIQNGSAVVGEFRQEMRSGKIQGEAKGDLCKFVWTERKAMVSNRAQETRGHGYFRYIVDKGNGDHLLKGEWGLGDAQTGGGPWNGYKAKNKEPKLTEKTSGGESDSEGEGESESDSKKSDENADDLF